MRWNSRLNVRLLLLGLFAALLPAQQPRTITLKEAEELALRNHPQLASARFNAEASGAVVKQVRSAFQPVLTGSLTTVGADSNTSIAAGTIQTSGLTSRAATGLGFSQLVTDFGRTSKLADSARLRNAAQDRNVDATRAQILLRVNQAYYAVLAAEAVLRVAQARLEMQQVTLRQVRALAESSLKSTLDVSFAEVAVSEAELALYQAENNVKASRAQLAAAMGETKAADFEVVDVPMPDRIPEDLESLVQEALRRRPDLAALNLSQSAAERFAEAEKKLRYPAISAVGVLGAVPVRQGNLASQYSAVGLNVSIPFLNGGLNAARHAEAELRARGTAKDAEALALQIAADVRVAWIEADNAWQKLGVTARLVDQAATTLRLAQARYDIGLSGILELTQAQLSLTTAQIASANAKYEYLAKLANLNYATGALH
ncbi:MAG: TolC family protein [Bryobacteraceae bacterium]|jgi:Outer membrane protein|nr:TolC family protein [Bryobacteraceae bacterium]